MPRSQSHGARGRLACTELTGKLLRLIIQLTASHVGFMKKVVTRQVLDME